MQDKTELMQKILELQETDYKNTLALIGIIELLIEKGIFTASELADKTSCIHETAFHPSGAEGA